MTRSRCASSWLRSRSHVRVLVTVGPQADPALVGTQSARVRAERYVPQVLVLSHRALVVSHGGSGTVLATLTRRLAQLCLPHGADQFLNASAVASAGAGISLAPDDVIVSCVREAASRLRTDATFRDAACRISASIASMPTPDEAAEFLETVP